MENINQIGIFPQIFLLLLLLLLLFLLLLLLFLHVWHVCLYRPASRGFCARFVYIYVVMGFLHVPMTLPAAILIDTFTA